MSTPIDACRSIGPHEYLGRRSDVGNDNGRNLKVCAVLYAMTGENVDCLGPDCVAQLGVRRMVADDERSAEVNVPH
jgi:hypothetical protein